MNHFFQESLPPPMSPISESLSIGSPHRKKMLEQFDQLLAQRRKECLAAKADYFQPNFKNISSYLRSLGRYRHDFRTLLGWPLSPLGKRASGKPKLELVSDSAQGQVYRVWIPALGALQAYGLLFLPPTPPPYRFVISQHGGLGTPETTADFHGPNNYNRMSWRLVREGYAVFAPQLFLSWGEDWGGYRDQNHLDRDLKHAGSSLAALHLHLLTKITDWILARPDVAGDSIGFVGFSYGGFYALAFAALDPRVATVVSSGILNDPFRYMAEDRTWFGSAEKITHEELCALVCPRPLYVEFGAKDDLFAADSAHRIAKKARRYYSQLKLANRFEVEEHEGAHEFNSAQSPLNFLKKHFPPTQ